MAMPPTLRRPSEGEIRAFYKTLAAATPLPVFIQNWGGAGGTPMPAKLVADLMRDNPTCCCVKEETEFSSQVMTDIQVLSGGSATIIMGGKSGRQVIDEYRRGACGTMPACELPDIQVKLWELLEAGQEEKAEEIYRALLPLLTFEVGYGPRIWKAVLHRRGIIRSPAVRQTGGRRFDDAASAYLDRLLRQLEPLMHPSYRLRIRP